MSAKSKCGSYTLVGPAKGQSWKLAHSRLFCKSLRCPYCRKPKLKRIRARIAQVAQQFGLKRFASLTLDSKKLGNRERSDRYIRQCWRKMRVLLERRFGGSVQFIGVLEFQKNGMAHLHLLLGVYIPQDWLSQAWQSIGGGEVVDIRYVDVQRVAGYVSTYLAGEKIEHTLDLLPLRARIFTTSRGIRLTEKRKSEGWWIVRRSISLIEFASKNPTAHRYKDEKVRSPLLVYFESAVDPLSIHGRNAFTILRKLVAAAGNADSTTPIEGRV
jgi:hypothetical protein